jgi:hypothetical protein
VIDELMRMEDCWKNTDWEKRNPEKNTGFNAKFSPKIPLRQTWDRTRTYTVTGHRVTA